MKTQLMMVKAMVRSFIRDEKAATMVEYALMVALIAVVCIVAVSLLGTAASTKFSETGASISAAS
jgi:pilus assembly protein Flp/PilA